MQQGFSFIEDEDSCALENESAMSPKRLLKNANLHAHDSSDSEDHNSKPLSQKKTKVMKIRYNTSLDNMSVDPDMAYKSDVTLSNIVSVPRGVSKKANDSPSGSDGSDDDNVQEIPGGYDPKLYENLDVGEEAKEILQYITKYTPQQLNLDYKFKPFIPNYIPAVGDIDAFLKVLPPNTTIKKEKFDEKLFELGLRVLDEPAANQSDPALLFLQIRAKTVILDKKNDANVVVKKIQNIEENGKVIDKWIKDISDLRKSKSLAVVRYEKNMPDLNNLMQEWSDEMESIIKTDGFLKPQKNTNISEYIETVCNTFSIPVVTKKIHSLYLLFCLYTAIKQTQLYQVSAVNEKSNDTQMASKIEVDQLVLEHTT